MGQGDPKIKNTKLCLGFFRTGVRSATRGQYYESLVCDLGVTSLTTAVKPPTTKWWEAAGMLSNIRSKSQLLVKKSVPRTAIVNRDSDKYEGDLFQVTVPKFTRIDEKIKSCGHDW